VTESPATGCGAQHRGVAACGREAKWLATQHNRNCKC
jgi:hypothetical protein